MSWGTQPYQPPEGFESRMVMNSWPDLSMDNWKGALDLPGYPRACASKGDVWGLAAVALGAIYGKPTFGSPYIETQKSWVSTLSSGNEFSIVPTLGINNLCRPEMIRLHGLITGEILILYDAWKRPLQ